MQHGSKLHKPGIYQLPSLHVTEVPPLHVTEVPLLHVTDVIQGKGKSPYIFNRCVWYLINYFNYIALWQTKSSMWS